MKVKTKKKHKWGHRFCDECRKQFRLKDMLKYKDDLLCIDCHIWYCRSEGLGQGPIYA